MSGIFSDVRLASEDGERRGPAGVEVAGTEYNEARDELQAAVEHALDRCGPSWAAVRTTGLAGVGCVAAGLLADVAVTWRIGAGLVVAAIVGVGMRWYLQRSGARLIALAERDVDDAAERQGLLRDSDS
ncbi:MAG TPA: hypothetical protein VK486_06305 [Thermoleophilaceae bacterium]|nr:hypothetical protein [Thermoleophilaceae bacterium]